MGLDHRNKMGLDFQFRCSKRCPELKYISHRLGLWSKVVFIGAPIFRFEVMLRWRYRILLRKNVKFIARVKKKKKRKKNFIISVFKDVLHSNISVIVWNYGPKSFIAPQVPI